MLHRIGCRALWALAIFIAVVMLALSMPTHAVAAAPVCVTGARGVSPSAVVSFIAPTLQSDGTSLPAGIALTYSVYQGTASGAEVKVASGLVGSPVTINTGLTSATTYYWYVTVTDSGGESSPSNEACKIFPAAVPGIVTITVN
jgi:hypothetical protein